MSDETKLSAVPDAPQTEEQKAAEEKEAAIAGCKTSMTMLSRIHDLLKYGLFVGGNCHHVSEASKFLEHTMVQAKAQLLALDPDADKEPMPLEKQPE